MLVLGTSAKGVAVAVGGAVRVGSDGLTPSRSAYLLGRSVLRLLEFEVGVVITPCHPCAEADILVEVHLAVAVAELLVLFLEDLPQLSFVWVFLTHLVAPLPASE